jgi:hypothetical protein
VRGPCCSFALVLLGLKSMLGSIVLVHGDVVGELVNGVIVSVVMLMTFPVLIPRLIEFVNEAAHAVGTADLSHCVFSPSFGPPIVQVVLFVILLFFAIRPAH